MSQVPTGRVKWYDADKGFGFVSQEDGEDVHVRSSALPAGVPSLKPGQKVEFSIADGRRGPQALQVRVLEAPVSLTQTLAAANRRTPDELHGLLEDVIKLIDAKILPELGRGRYPDRALGKRIGTVLHAIANELEV